MITNTVYMMFTTKSRYQSRLVTCCSQCSGIIFIIAVARWMYDHAFIMQKLLQYFEEQVTHMSKTNEHNSSTRHIVI